MKQRDGERGHLMVGLMAAVAIMIILSTVAVQEWADVLRRDKEEEMIFRARDITRAIKRFQKDQGRLPTELDELTKPGNMRQYFLRQLWKDPLVKDGKWGLLYQSPQGGIFDPSAPQTDQGQETTETLGLSTNTAPSSMGTPVGFGTDQQEVGGLPIVGVKTKCTDKPFKILNGEEDYANWRFTIMDQDLYSPTLPGQPAGGVGRPGGLGPAAGGQTGAPGTQRRNNLPTNRP